MWLPTVTSSTPSTMETDLSWEVWSSGLEEWEPVVEVHHGGLTVLYHKTVQGHTYIICRDELGRYWHQRIE